MVGDASCTVTRDHRSELGQARWWLYSGLRHPLPMTWPASLQPCPFIFCPSSIPHWNISALQSTLACPRDFSYVKENSSQLTVHFILNSQQGLQLQLSPSASSFSVLTDDQSCKDCSQKTHKSSCVLIQIKTFPFDMLDIKYIIK